MSLCHLVPCLRRRGAAPCSASCSAVHGYLHSCMLKEPGLQVRFQTQNRAPHTCYLGRFLQVRGGHQAVVGLPQGSQAAQINEAHLQGCHRICFPLHAPAGQSAQGMPCQPERLTGWSSVCSTHLAGEVYCSLCQDGHLAAVHQGSSQPRCHLMLPVHVCMPDDIRHLCEHQGSGQV